MKVKVIGTYQVFHDGEAYTEGDTIDAPDAVAQQWIDSGYAEESDSKAESKAKQSSSNKAQKSSNDK